MSLRLEEDDDDAPIITAKQVKQRIVVQKQNDINATRKVIVIQKRPLTQTKATSVNDEAPSKKVKIQEVGSKKVYVPYKDDPRLPEIVSVSIKNPKPFDVYVCNRYVPEGVDLKTVDPRLHSAESYPFYNPYYKEPEEIGSVKYEEQLRRNLWNTVIAEMAIKHGKNGKRLKLGCWCNPVYAPRKEGDWCVAKTIAKLVYERKLVYDGLKAEAARYKALCICVPKESWRRVVKDLDDTVDVWYWIRFTTLRRLIEGDEKTIKDETFFAKAIKILDQIRSLSDEPTQEMLSGDSLRILLSPFYAKTEYAWVPHPFGESAFSRGHDGTVVSKMTFASGPSRENSERGYVYEISLSKGLLRTPPMIVNFSHEEKRNIQEMAKIINPNEPSLESTASEDFVVSFLDEHDSYVHECSASPMSIKHASFMNFIEDTASALFESTDTQQDAESLAKTRACLLDGFGCRFYASIRGYEGTGQDLFEGSIVEIWFDVKMIARVLTTGETIFRPLLKMERVDILSSPQPTSSALSILK